MSSSHLHKLCMTKPQVQYLEFRMHPFPMSDAPLPQVWALRACLLLFSQNPSLYPLSLSLFFLMSAPPSLRRRKPQERQWSVGSLRCSRDRAAPPLRWAEGPALRVLSVCAQAAAKLPSETHRAESVRHHTAGRQRHNQLKRDEHTKEIFHPEFVGFLSETGSLSS